MNLLLFSRGFSAYVRRLVTAAIAVHLPLQYLPDVQRPTARRPSSGRATHHVTSPRRRVAIATLEMMAAAGCFALAMAISRDPTLLELVIVSLTRVAQSAVESRWFCAAAAAVAIRYLQR